MKKLFILLAFVSSFVMNAQNYGRIIVYSKSGQQFLISFNGVRLSNDYTSKAVLNYGEDVDYKVRLWFPRTNAPINFNVAGGAGYETVYVLEIDQYGAYALTLESKIVFTALPPGTATVVIPAPTITVPATPTIAVIKEMEDADFKMRLNTVKSESFDDGKLKKAKFVFDKEYFSSEQAAALVKLFSFETKKVEIAKFAYKKTIDKKNYYKVVDALTFDSYKKDLQDWIMKNP